MNAQDLHARLHQTALRPELLPAEVHKAATDAMRQSLGAVVVTPVYAQRVTAMLQGAAVRVHADGHRKAQLWTGASGRVTACLNGEMVLERDAGTRYRIGQFRTPVELRPGENLLTFRLLATNGEPRLSALLVGPRNDGDTVEGIRWSV